MVLIENHEYLLLYVRRTGGVVVNGHRLIIAVVVTAEQCLEVAVLVPVERFDLEAAAFRVPADDARHSLVHHTG